MLKVGPLGASRLCFAFGALVAALPHLGCATGEPGAIDLDTSEDAAGPGSGGAPTRSSSSSSSSSSTSSGDASGGAGGDGDELGGGGAGGDAAGATGGYGGSGEGGGSTGGSATTDPCAPPTGAASYPLEVEPNDAAASATAIAAGAMGATASICPAGDIDLFTVDVPQGGSLAVEISDGQGSCPPGVAFWTRVLTPTGQLVASSSAGCTAMGPTNTPKLADLSSGTYTVRVENASFGTIDAYTLAVDVTVPTCGDGLLQLANGEQCDDQNATLGDGCDQCALELDLIVESEPNGPPDAPNSLDGHEGAFASITLGDHDLYTFTVTAPGSSVVVEITDGLNGCPTGFDSMLAIRDSNGALVASDDDSGTAACSRIAPGTHPGATNLAVGTYTIEVNELGDNSTTPFYVLQYKVMSPGCGDYSVDGSEQCDDGNTTSGDGCSATCQLEGNYLTETEPNGTLQEANALGGFDGALAAIDPVGDQDHFRFNVTVPGSVVTIRTSDGLDGCPAGFDSKIYLYDALGTELAVDDEGGADSCSSLASATHGALANLPAGPYTVKVEEYGNNEAQPFYVLEVEVALPSCGDAIPQGGEQCDDGNTTSGDGCSATCSAEAPNEIEPNGSLATATPLWPGTSKWTGAIFPLGDHDWYTFTLTAPASVTLETHAKNVPGDCGFDTLIHLTDAAGAPIDSDDDSGVGSCSLLSSNGLLPAGTYYVWVQRYADSSTIAAYDLELIIQ